MLRRKAEPTHSDIYLLQFKPSNTQVINLNLLVKATLPDLRLRTATTFLPALVVWSAQMEGNLGGCFGRNKGGAYL